MALRESEQRHLDHVAVGAVTLCAVYPDARTSFTFPELRELPAWTMPAARVKGRQDSDLHIDSTDTFDRKLAALRAHTSQTADLDDLEERLRAAGTARTRPPPGCPTDDWPRTSSSVAIPR